MFVVSVSGLLQLENIPHSFPLREQLLDEHYFTGGSAIASPDGNWVVEPISQTRGLITAELDLAMVARERLLFDSAGHYARPDVFDVRIHRKRLVAAQFIEDVVEDGHATIHVAKDAA